MRKRARASASPLASTMTQAKAVAAAILDTDVSLVAVTHGRAWLKSRVGAGRTRRSGERPVSGFDKIVQAAALHPAAPEDTSHRRLGGGIGHASRNRNGGRRHQAVRGTAEEASLTSTRRRPGSPS
jgi:hypothetical protein